MALAGERLGAEEARELIRRRFPQLQTHQLRRPTGFSEFDAWDVDDVWIARIAHTAEFGEKLRRERLFLERVAESLPIAVPRIELWSEGLPTVALHRKLPGLPADDGGPHRPPREERPAVANQLGELLRILHSTPLDICAAIGLPLIQLPRPIDLIERVKSVASDLHDVELPVGAGDYLAGAIELPPTAEGHVVLHGDLKGEHLLFEPSWRRVVGVIDWADIAIGDAVHDLARLVSWLGRSFAETALERYAGGSELILARAVFYARARNLIGLADRVTGRNDWPLELAESLVRYSFD